MTHREFRDWLRRVEAAYPVTEWRVGGLRVWPLVRGIIYGSNFHARTEGFTLGQSTAGYARLVAQAMAAWSRATVLDAPRTIRPGSSGDAVFLAYSVGRQPVVEGRRYNPLLAPYVELLGRRGLRSTVWEMSPFGDYNIPRTTPSSLVQPWMIWWRLRAQLVRHRLPEVLDGFERFAAEVVAAGFSFPYAAPMRLQRDAWFVLNLARHLAAWLRRVRPRVGFVADTSVREMAFCLACRRVGIPSVEIQHGVQGPYHPAYAGWTAVPRDGFEVKPRLFWNWDQASADAIDEWASTVPNAHGTVVGGDPWREMWLGDSSETARRTLSAVSSKVAAAGGERHILVTLSSNREVLPPSVIEAVSRGPAEWRWWFRMHPVNQSARRAGTMAVLASLGQDIERMDFATTTPLYALLRRMNAHVTVGLSTVVQEAAAVGVPSVACMDEAKDFYAAEIADGMVRVSLDGDSMLAALTAFLAAPGAAPVAPRPDPNEALTRVLATEVAAPAAVAVAA